MALIFVNIIVDQIWLKATIFGLLMWAPVSMTQQPTKLYGRNKKRGHDERGSEAEAPGNAK